MDMTKIDDAEIIFEISRRFEEKNASIKEMEFMTKKLLDLNERTNKAEQVKTEFLSLIKNEFNNPLSSLLNMAQILEGNPSHDSAVKAIRIINSELFRLDFHFKNIFAASDIEAGDTANYYTTINFESIFQDCVKMFRYIIEDKKLEIAYVESGEGKRIGDSNKIFMIMLNLLSNAVEYSHDESKITIGVELEENAYTITAEDFGEEIKLEQHNLIYERFSKFNSGRRSHMGLGLGLSVIRGLAEAMSGEVGFESKDGWTLFKATIPTNTEEAKIADGSEDAGATMFENFDNEF